MAHRESGGGGGPGQAGRTTDGGGAGGSSACPCVQKLLRAWKVFQGIPQASKGFSESFRELPRASKNCPRASKNCPSMFKPFRRPPSASKSSRDTLPKELSKTLQALPMASQTFHKLAKASKCSNELPRASKASQSSRASKGAQGLLTTVKTFQGLQRSPHVFPRTSNYVQDEQQCSKCFQVLPTSPTTFQEANPRPSTGL